MQNSVIALANVVVQTNINSFGKAAMAGCGSYSKLEGFAFLPVTCFTQALSTFVGQNLGAGQPKRAKKSVGIALGMTIGSLAALMIPLLIFAPQLVGFFNPKQEVVEFGSLLLRLISPFYLVYSIHDVVGGALRGSGNSKIPMMASITFFVVFRQIYLYIMANHICNDVVPIAMAYPAGWVLSSIFMALYFRHTKLTNTRLVEK